MATQVQHRRGSTAQHATFTGAIGEITVDTTKKTAVIQDGSTAGGIPLARDDQKNDGSLGYAQDVKTDNYSVVAADAGKMLVANKATAITFTLGAAASLTSKFVAVFKNINAGALSIAPTGAELIDGANMAVTVQAGASVLIKCDGSSFRTYLSNGDVTGNAINTAPALTGANLSDNDKLGVYDVSAAGLVSILFSELIAGVFKTARTIVNAQFAAATFKLFNQAGTPRALTFDATALTADHKITMPNRDVGFDVASQDIPLSGAAVLVSAVPAGARRIRIVGRVAFSANAELRIQLGTSAGVVTTGYNGSRSRLDATNAGSIAWTGNGADVMYGGRLSAAPQITLERIGNGNEWSISSIAGLPAQNSMDFSGGYVLLPGGLDRIQITTIAGTSTMSGNLSMTVEF